jgi:uncharacterized protein
MAKRHQLLKVNVPDTIVVEILGPKPPKRLEAYSPTTARLKVESHITKELEVTQNQNLISKKFITTCEPFLFEEMTYEFIAEIKDKNTQAKNFVMKVSGKKPSDEPRQIGNTNAYTSQINFGSQIGYVDLEFLLDNNLILIVGLEVFPSKLDYRSDLWEIRNDIENEVRDLAFDIGRLTYHRAQRRRDVKAREVEWLENLRELFSELTKAFNRIKRAPRYTIYRDEQIKQASRPSCAGASVRRYVRSHASECVEAVDGHFNANGKSWQIRRLPYERKRLTYDTIENRYIKWALQTILRLVRKSMKKLRETKFSETNRMIDWKTLLETTEQRLRKKLDSAFLSECNVEILKPPQSLALHMAPGYREFFSTFLDLISGLKIYGGPFKLSEKDLSILYEMWCFIKLGNILRKDLCTDAVPDWLKIGRKGIGVSLEKGKTSVLSLKSNKNEKVYLLYNPREETPTGRRIPDNVLEIKKSGSILGFHYIFDAKYRLCDDSKYIENHGAPGPPEDTINKMHAYRDQIVANLSSSLDSSDYKSLLWDQGKRRFVQKNVAAFVLFPYAGDTSKNRFMRSIDDVGIGGLPFLPGNTQPVRRLLNRLVGASSETEEDQATSFYTGDERLRIEWSHQYGLMGIVRHEEQLDFILRNKIYHMPYTKLRGARLKADFILLFQSKRKFGTDAGIQYWGKVKSFQITPRPEISPAPTWPTRKEGLYAWFKLDNVQKLPRPFPPAEKGHPAYFRVTTKLAFKTAKSIEELSLIREPERRLFHELIRAGLDVEIREDIDKQKITYDIADLRLVFRVSKENKNRIHIRFDPKTSAFWAAGNKIFKFEDLMFSAEQCVETIENLFID